MTDLALRREDSLTMRDIRIGTAQFEHRDGDVAYNLEQIRTLAQRAAEAGAEIVCFHECAAHGYSWLQPLTHAELLQHAEIVPDGPITQRLIQIAREMNLVVMAGLLEKDREHRVYNSYVTVAPDGFVTKFHKLHTFVNPHLSPGDRYQVIDLCGCKIGFLICYDNNLPENVRITTLMGAEILIAPHVTGCLPSTMPGRGVVDRVLWDNRDRDPVRLRQEFQGPKGRGWLMRWLPARAWENGIYVVFSNPIGWDYDTVKPGLAMILDPYGEVLQECSTLGDDVIVATLTEAKLQDCSGQRYLKARRPELYARLVEPQQSVTLPGWQLKHRS